MFPLSKGEDTNFLCSLKEASFQGVEKSYNRKGNLRFKSSNEAENFVMEGRKAGNKLRKKKRSQKLLQLAPAEKIAIERFILYYV